MYPVNRKRRDLRELGRNGGEKKNIEQRCGLAERRQKQEKPKRKLMSPSLNLNLLRLILIKDARHREISSLVALVRARAHTLSK